MGFSFLAQVASTHSFLEQLLILLRVLSVSCTGKMVELEALPPRSQTCLAVSAVTKLPGVAQRAHINNYTKQSDPSTRAPFLWPRSRGFRRPNVNSGVILSLVTVIEPPPRGRCGNYCCRDDKELMQSTNVCSPWDAVMSCDTRRMHLLGFWGRASRW